MADSLKLRETYAVTSELSTIYSGGPMCIGVDGKEGYFNGGDRINQVDLETGRILNTVPTTGELSAIAFHPETRQLVYSSSAYLLVHFRLSESKPAEFELQRQWKGHQKPVTTLSFHPSGKFIASGSTDRTAKVWDLTGGFCTHHFKGHSGVVNFVKYKLFSIQNKYLFPIFF